MEPLLKTFKPSGILNDREATELRQQINDAIAGGIKVMLIDFKKVTFMDSSGLGVLTIILKNIREAGGRLFLMSVNEQIKMLFELTNTIEVFEFIDSQEELEKKVIGNR